MILAYATFAIILVALILRRDFVGLTRIKVKNARPFAIIVILLFLLQMAAVIFQVGQSNFQLIVLNLPPLIITLFLLRNRHIPGVYIFVLGVLLNSFVMLANGGRMPVTPETHQMVHPEQDIVVNMQPKGSKNVILPQSETRLWVLSDILRVNLPWRNSAMSVGDVLLILGIGQFIFQVTNSEFS